MKIIGKHIQLIGILLLTVLVGAAAGLYFDVPGRIQKETAKSVVGLQYTCSMHPDVVSAKPGDCSKRGMALISASEAKAGHDQCGDNREKHPGCCADKSAATCHAAETAARTSAGSWLDNRPAAGKRAGFNQQFSAFLQLI